MNQTLTTWKTRIGFFLYLSPPLIGAMIQQDGVSQSCAIQKWTRASFFVARWRSHEQDLL